MNIKLVPICGFKQVVSIKRYVTKLIIWQDSDLIEILEDKHNRKRAVVFDIDETVLDNSFGGAYELKNKLDWDHDSFNSWVELKKAEAIPGAREFIVYAISKRVEVIYISNRSNAQKESTIINFNRLGIPIKKENLYFMDNEWSKEKRRRARSYRSMTLSCILEIILLILIRLGITKKAKSADALVDNYRKEFGQKVYYIAKSVIW